MAYGYNYNPQTNGATVQPPAQQIPAMQMQNLQQNIQPLFPQPQGNVYNINSTLEVANVPVGAGISVALCMPENIMYIKTMQNGNPLFYPYRILPFTSESAQSEQKQESQSDSDIISKISDQLRNCNERITNLEEKIQAKKKGGD